MLKQQKVNYRCQFCGKCNPGIEVHVIGGDRKQRILAFVMECCKKVLNSQLEQMPAVTDENPEGAPVSTLV
jgi:hypothetical protein